MVKHASLLNLVSGSAAATDISGSELFKRISKHEETLYPAPPAATSSAPGSSRKDWRALLIGVSTRLEEDAPKLCDGGADIVWGKPPPRMDDDLRALVVATLARKRQGDRVRR